MTESFKLIVPDRAIHQYRYGATVLFECCLGWQVDVHPGSDESVQLFWQDQLILQSPVVAAESSWRQVELSVAQFQISSRDSDPKWPSTLPGLLVQSDASNSNDSPKPLAALNGHVSLSFDVIWSSFFLASGAWELRYGKVDEHQRIQGKESWAAVNGFADKPVINYYAEEIFHAISEVHRFERKQREYQRFVSCDVDRPFDPACYEPKRFIKRVARNVVIERRLGPLKQTLSTAYAVRKKGFAGDPNNTFDYLFDLNERAGNTVRFFFMTEKNNQYDAEYQLADPMITDLFQRIVRRGHELGLHGSFYSQFEDGRLGNEKKALQVAMESAGADATQVSNRQHWLRWDVENSPSHSEQAGIAEDWTLGFDDWPGFRRSICVPYPLYDFESELTLAVTERPLNVMECSLIGANHTVDADWELIEDAYQSCATHCRRVAGEFHLLWHNHHLLTQPHRQLYEKLISV